ncbi:hypothetical protein CLOM_g12335 [Closterium sp. NIES-68]|nr:hypothetical protein CLOM_g22086 [Closterium sp. NIES-68]GJP53144.1 hypothetical protein CLOM_g12335 [Closterium sp. NIES-68]GJP63127.1 hypothetical protein CLOP_g20205 [Closterium sp. NIES-67]GJP68346.1 hypothetical protein CLOP_g25068 [Closterium sp. NIES-67]
MYIRAKRRVTTYFVYCEPSHKVLQVKHNLEVLCGQPPSDMRLILLHTNALLDDNRTLAEQRVENDAVVALTYRLSDDNEWEPVCIEKPDDGAVDMDHMG